MPSVIRAEELRTKVPNFKRYGAVYVEGTKTLTDEWKQLTDVVFACAFCIGIKDPPSKSALLIYAQFIQSQFKDLNPLEVKEAFDMYAAEALDFKSPHFHSFDNVFIGRVLKSYMRDRNKKLTVYNNSKVTLIEYKPTKEEKEHEERLYYHFELFQKYETYRETKEYTWKDIISQWLFVKLEKLGVVNITPKEKQLFASDIEVQVRKHQRANIKLGILRVVKNKKNKTEEIVLDRLNFAKHCRAQFFRRWIEEQDFADVDIIEVVLAKLKEKHDGNGKIN